MPGECDRVFSQVFLTNCTSFQRAEDLRYVFCKYGTVRDVYIPRDYYSRKPRGFAYVEYERSKDAENAIRNAHRLRMFGKDLEVEYAQGDRKSIYKSSKDILKLTTILFKLQMK